MQLDRPVDAPWTEPYAPCEGGVAPLLRHCRKRGGICTREARRGGAERVAHVQQQRRRLARTALSSAITSTSSKKRSRAGPISAADSTAASKSPASSAPRAPDRAARSPGRPRARPARRGAPDRARRRRPAPSPRAAPTACRRCGSARSARPEEPPALARAERRRRGRALPAGAARTYSTGTSSSPSKRSSTNSATSGSELRAGSSGCPPPRAGRDRSRPAAARTDRASRSACARARRRRSTCRSCPPPRGHAPPRSAGAGVGRVRQVLLVDRGRDRLRVAGEPRVLGADVTLELRELAHELGRLVGLGQSRRLERRLATAERLDELRKPLRLVAKEPAPGEERDRTEPLRRGSSIPTLRSRSNVNDASSSRPSTTFSKPAAHRVRVAAVRDEREAVLAEREGADVVLDRGLDDPARELQVALVEPPVDDDGVLDQEDDLVEDAVRVAPAAEASSASTICARRALVGLDVGGAQRLDVRRGISALPRAGREPVPTDARRRRSSGRRSCASRQRTGRGKRRPPSSQRIVFEKARPCRSASTCSGSTSAAACPDTSTPRKPSRSWSSSTATPCRFAKPAAAFSGIVHGGPLTHSSGVLARARRRRGPRAAAA